MRRSAALIAVLACLAVPAASLAQSNPFSPLPEAGTPVPTPTAVKNANQGDVSRTALFGIAGAVALVFLGIGVFITRDARRNLNETDRAALEGSLGRPGAERQRQQVAKQRARAKGRAQRQARKAQRRR